jgi:hypothetical protein
MIWFPWEKKADPILWSNVLFTTIGRSNLGNRLLIGFGVWALGFDSWSKQKGYTMMVTKSSHAKTAVACSVL